MVPGFVVVCVVPVVMVLVFVVCEVPVCVVPMVMVLVFVVC